MQTNLLAIDSAFTNRYRELFEIQKGIKVQLYAYPFDLSKSEITDAIINRMDAFWYFNVNNNKEILGRKINTTAADFFTETCLLFFKCYFEKEHRLKVFSEKNINIGKKPVIRPDISIWNNEETKLIAAIELKVSNGWKRANIFSHLEEREKQIKRLHPDAFFGIIAFWNFFKKDADGMNKDGWNKKNIGLKEWNEKENHPRTEARIENLMKEIEKVIK